MKKNIILTCLAILVFTGIKAQYYNNVIPPSPVAASLGKYADWPVSYYSGTPRISLPLYTVNGRELELPISLSYHASGIKVSDYGEMVGVGWSLNAGGAITRSIVDLPDEKHTYGFKAIGDKVPEKGFPLTGKNYKFFRESTMALMDDGPDKFYYNLAGRSGRFSYGNDGELHTIPYENIQIDLMGNYCTLTVEDGTQYICNTPEYTYSSTEGYADINFYLTSWYLTKMVSPDKTDTIYFEYVDKIRKTWRPFDWVKISEQSVLKSDDGECNYLEYSGLSISKNLDSYISNGAAGYNGEKGKVLKTVRSSKAEVNFYTHQVTDSKSEFTVLDSIEIYSMVSGIKELFKTYVLTYATPKHRYFLSSVTEVGHAGKKEELYSISYMNISEVPGCLSNDVDHWGYYNGAGNMHQIPKLVDMDLYKRYNSCETFTTKNIDGSINWTYYRDEVPPYKSLVFDWSQIPISKYADREVNGEKSLTGIIKKIVYPTKGYTNFIFEPHKDDDGNVIMSGGRIAQMQTYGADGRLLRNKIYKYAKGKSFLLSKTYCKLLGNNTFAIESAPMVFGSFSGTPVGYETVTEYEQIYHLDAEEKTKTEYTFTHQDDFVYWDYGNASVPTTETYNGGGSDCLKNVTDIFTEGTPRNYFGYPYTPVTDMGWARGILLSKKYYNCLFAGERLVRKEEYEYNNWWTKEMPFSGGYDPAVFSNTYITKGMKIGLKDVKFGMPFGSCYLNCVFSDDQIISEYDFRGWLWEPFYVYSYWIKLLKKTVYEYPEYGEMDGDGNIVEPFITDYSYEYDDVTGQVRSISKSNGTKTIYYYPTDKPAETQGTNSNLDQMVSDHRLSPIIKKEVIRDNKTISKELNFYGLTDIDGTDFILPDSTELYTGSERSQTFKYLEYDKKGNIAEVTQTASDIPVVYIWGYEHNYPVAKITNASLSEVKSAMNNLISSGNYSLISSIEDIEECTNVNVLTSFFKDLRGQLDDGVSVVSYTYEPTKGVSTVMDENGLATNYDYDDLGKLKSVADNDNNIVSEYRYNFSDITPPEPVAPYLTVTPWDTYNEDELTYGLEGQKVYIQVKSNTRWQVTTSASWMTLSKTNGGVSGVGTSTFITVDLSAVNCNTAKEDGLLHFFSLDEQLNRDLYITRYLDFSHVSFLSPDCNIFLEDNYTIQYEYMNNRFSTVYSVYLYDGSTSLKQIVPNAKYTINLPENNLDYFDLKLNNNCSTYSLKKIHKIDPTTLPGYTSDLWPVGFGEVDIQSINTVKLLPDDMTRELYLYYDANFSMSIYDPVKGEYIDKEFDETDPGKIVYTFSTETYPVYITYRPLTYGHHKAIVRSVSDLGVSRVYEITGTVPIVPTLNSFTLPCVQGTAGCIITEPDITITPDVVNLPAQYRISENAGFVGADWQNYTNGDDIGYTFSGYGARTVYLQFANEFGKSNVMYKSCDYPEDPFGPVYFYNYYKQTDDIVLVPANRYELAVAGILNLTVNIDLYKGEVLLENLKTNVHFSDNQNITLPDDLEAGNDYIIKLTVVDGSGNLTGQYGYTPYFTIEAVKNPFGSIYFSDFPGQTEGIVFSLGASCSLYSENDVGANVNIDLYKGGEFYLNIGYNAYFSNNISFTLPPSGWAEAGNDYYLRFSVMDSEGNQTGNFGYTPTFTLQ